MATRFRLRLTGKRRDGNPIEPHLFSLYDAERGASGLVLSDGGAVDDIAHYALELFSEADLGDSRAVVSIDDRDPFPAAIEPAGEQVLEGSRYMLYRLGGDPSPLFDMAYGFTRVSVSLDGDVQARLVTRDIPVRSAFRDREETVAAMLEALAGAEDGTVAGWMLAGAAARDERAAALAAANQGARAKSVARHIELAEDAARACEEHMAFFNRRAHSTVTKREERVPLDKARRFGVRELAWLARNPEVLAPAAGGAVAAGGRRYMPQAVETERKVKSHANYENETVLGLLDAISKDMAAVVAAIDEGMRGLEDVERRLSVVQEQGGCMPALVIVRACMAREEPLRARARAARRRLQRFSRLYAAALPDAVPRFPARLHRTKVFQEVKPYSDFYALALRKRDLGELSMAGESYALGAYRIDRLYEYYALYRLLDGLHQAGFSPEAREDAVELAEWSVESRFYRPDDNVVNVYRLARGQQRATLYYQPAIYSDDTEEHGVTLHMTAMPSFLPAANQVSRLPDYLLALREGEGPVRWVVLDAKFRRIADLTRDERESVSEFRKCYLKYKAEVADSAGAGVEAVWLLCGREARGGLVEYESSPWASAHLQGAPSGLASVAPGADGMDALLAALGLAGSAQEQASPEPDPAAHVQAAPAPERRRGAAKAKAEVGAAPEPEPRTDGEPVVDPEVLALVEALYEMVGNKRSLYAMRASKRHLSLKQPLLKDPERTDDLAGYAKVNLCGDEVYLYAGWNAFETVRLRRLVKGWHHDASWK